MKPFLFILAFLSILPFTRAQAFLPSVIASDGNFASTPSGSISWTLGEVITETFSDPSNIFTQGFQQPKEFNTGVVDQQSKSLVKYYPNPAADNLFILTGNLNPGDYIIQVFTIQGEELHSESCVVGIAQNLHNLSVTGLPNGMYLVRFYEKQGSFSTTFKFTKAG
jgi:hypothetical protein